MSINQLKWTCIFHTNRTFSMQMFQMFTQTAIWLMTIYLSDSCEISADLNASRKTWHSLFSWQTHLNLKVFPQEQCTIPWPSGLRFVGLYCPQVEMCLWLHYIHPTRTPTKHNNIHKYKTIKIHAHIQSMHIFPHQLIFMSSQHLKLYWQLAQMTSGTDFFFTRLGLSKMCSWWWQLEFRM